jgi:hypothetical protein
VVCPGGAAAPLAGNARSVSRLDGRGDPPADADSAGRGVFRALLGGVSNVGGAGESPPRGCPRSLAGPRLLSAGAQSPPGGAGISGYGGDSAFPLAGGAGDPAKSPRHWPIHGPGDFGFCGGGAPSSGGWQPRAGPKPAMGGDATPATERKAYQAKADALPPAFTGRAVGFALMDLAQLVCKPRRPTCLACPLRSACQAYQQGQSEAFPVKAARAPRPTRFFRLLVYYTAEAVWLVERPAKGLWGGLWTPPLEELPEPPFRPADLRHEFTHFRMLGFAERLSEPPPHTQPISWAELHRYGLPAPIRRYLTQLHTYFLKNFL